MDTPKNSGETKKQLGYQHASILSKTTYSFVDDLLRLGIHNQIDDNTAEQFFPHATDSAQVLSQKFDTSYERIQCKEAAHVASGAKPRSPSHLIWHTLLTIYRYDLLDHFLWSLAEVGARIGSPLILRQLLAWFTLNSTLGSDVAPPSTGWMWAGILAAFSYCYVFIHHQLFWRGMRLGMRMRVQMIAAVEKKVLKLHSTALATVATGKIINLVSNDVRRCDDSATFWVFLFTGPIELIIIFLLIGFRLGFAASIAGVATLLLLIPLHAVMARYIGRLRGATAAATDERVRLTSESISGILACKTLAWEGPLLEAITRARNKEASYIRRMNIVRAMNMAFSYSITPLTSLITFTTARYTGADLTVANVFYALALLALPKLYMAEFFVHAVEALSELRVSVRRIAEFLSLEEPPDAITPASLKEKDSDGDNNTDNDDIAALVEESDFDWNIQMLGRQSKETMQSHLQPLPAAVNSVNAADDQACVVEIPHSSQSPRNTLNTLNHQTPSTATPDHVNQHPTKNENENDSYQYTLSRFSLQIFRGELIALVGPVGCGKTSILSVLLGELQPLGIYVDACTHHPSSLSSSLEERKKRAVHINTQGSISYSQQIPWIMSDTIRENILFGQPYEKEKYDRVLSSCALDADLRAMPAGDLTEIGERGVSLSGGQKARVSLARAAYSNATLHLLDDPLSAVDPKVGRILFDRCMGNKNGIMKHSTRIIATHQRQYLSEFDRIFVVRRGRVIESGTFDELVKKGIEEVLVLEEAHFDGAPSGHTEDNTKDDDDIETKTAQDTIENNNSNDNHLLVSPSSPVSLPETIKSRPISSDGKSQKIITSQNTKFGLRPLRNENMSLFGSFRNITFRKQKTFQPANNAVHLSSHPSKILRSFISKKLKGVDTLHDENDDFNTTLQPEVDDDEESKKKRELLLKSIRSGVLTVKEDKAEGSVTWSTYGALFKKIGLVRVFVIACALLGCQAVYLYSEYWLSLWASKSHEEQMKSYWIWKYAIMVASVVIVSILRSLLFFISSLQASTALHNQAISHLLRAPLSFFHTNPSGRILNRFSKDQGALDEQLPVVAFDTLQASMMVAGAFILLCIVVPFILPVFIPLAIAFIWIQRRYLKTSRELKRFEATTRSPLYAAFSATLKGLPTIRAYRVSDRFRADFLDLLSKNTAWWFSWLTTARWIGFRLDFLVAILLTIAPLLMMAVHSKLSPRLVGLALTQSLYLAGMLQWMVRQSAEVENNMVSAERLLIYAQGLEQEPPTTQQGGASPPPHWPSLGSLKYVNVTAQYRPGLPDVLKNITFDLDGGLSCGVCGRTGSGKSSLMLTLFRLIPVTTGHIYIDSVDISKLGLDSLRRQLAIIPQDPVLFSGTLRSNLDPWDQFDDATLWDALESSQLRHAASALGGLDARMQDCGDNLSAGQRQLLCLARSLLQDAAILALDEATANVDRSTDAFIQNAVRRACGILDENTSTGHTGTGHTGTGGDAHAINTADVNKINSNVNGTHFERRKKRTLLVIAHRIDTIMDTHKILVLNHGVLVENGSLNELLNKKEGMFSQMVNAAKKASQQSKSA